ncbi:hypothetical protein CANARDRAFT_194385 [[Candida] arabinofermentans NRRL YB-2248]|uniref:mitogen-activated protein kinase kinase n=1 Tax=[Candida] arabinofermentans NRRL YB-2248 TaxID=983967 RepID=A0A1E4T6A9_9ASCO|nr:hypothetical protein CANARDRAFT_194385 [[Candida] arabinofermentans NRRL YB-2248]
MSSDQEDTTSKLKDLSIHTRSINPGVQAKLLAFQARRQQQQQQQQQQGSPQESSSHGPSSGHGTPIITRDEFTDTTGSAAAAESLIRRTSFRLPKKKLEIEENADGSSSNNNNNKIENPRDSLGKAFNSGKNQNIHSTVYTNASTPSSCESSGAPSPAILTPSDVDYPRAVVAARDSNKKSLSQRRGMKLDFDSLIPSSKNNATSGGTSSSPVKPSGSLPSLPSLNNAAMNKLKQNVLPQRGNNPNTTTPSLRGAPSSSSVASAIPKKKPNFKLAPGQVKPAGMFANYSKYVDIKSGSLNFSGKASLHSKGVDFSNGSSFRISQDDLEFLEEIGRGNYGIVSKVLHKPTGIIMAMKEVRLELDDSKFTQILMELEVLHACVSDCIVDFYGAFFVEGAVYMCMEYMQGGSLDKVYANGIDEPQLAFITKSVVQGLKKLKDDHNIIHRDVKPTNILVNEIGKVKLCDFGVSGNLVASLARTNIGCQSYMAPERIKSSSPDVATYTVQSDIWSLGLSILEIAKGCYPYPPETYDNIFSQLSAIVDGEPPTLPEGKYSLEAQDFVKQCLNKIPDKRPVYADLLQHPWMNKYEDIECQKLMSDMVLKILEKKAAVKQEQQQQQQIDENNQNITVPPLHRGGLNA